ncbi:MAG: aromatic hydrocarbon degradation protein, partial [Flavobacteriales bacterium]
MNKLKKLVVVLFVFCGLSAFAQLGTSSPYSRFGLGDLQGNAFPVYNALGGGVTALSSSNSVNPSNPASYTSFRANSFLFSTGGMHKTTQLQNSTDKQVVNNSAFSHLTIAFPISSK